MQCYRRGARPHASIRDFVNFFLIGQAGQAILLLRITTAFLIMPVYFPPDPIPSLF